MKILSLLVLLTSISAAQATLLAECENHGVSISVSSGKNALEALININGSETLAKRKMEDGMVTYKSSSVELTILGNHRQMGNPIGYLKRDSKNSTVVCSQGTDIEKIADDTDLY